MRRTAGAVTEHVQPTPAPLLPNPPPPPLTLGRWEGGIQRAAPRIEFHPTTKAFIKSLSALLDETAHFHTNCMALVYWYTGGGMGRCTNHAEGDDVGVQQM